MGWVVEGGIQKVKQQSKDLFSRYFAIRPPGAKRVHVRTNPN